MVKKLSKVLETITTLDTKKECKVSGLCLDSREIRAGDIFFAYAGYDVDGNDFIADAIAKKAVAVLTDNKDLNAKQFDTQVPIIFIENLKQQLSAIASNFYDQPSKKMQVIGITGTNGKTSFCHFLAQALTDLGETVGILGTLGNGIYGKHSRAKLTTPNPIQLQALLADMQKQGAKYVIMEASSHGIAQGRINDIEFDTAVFTNLSRDHLDYHGDMLAYGNAKRKLFETQSIKQLVLNIDDDFGRQLLEEFAPKIKVFGYSTKSNNNDFDIPLVRAKHVHLNMQGFTASLYSPWGDGLLHTKLLGNFNLSNLLAVFTTLGIYGYRIEDCLKVLTKTKSVLGRMQLFGGTNQPYVVIDFAHTPDALKQVLKTLRDYTKGELWCVFGCGGNRDQGKRSQMGQIAESFSDNVILTDDNPRNEDASAIVADILQSMKEPERVVVEHDRHRAIAHAINCAKIDDIILLAGKGHENYQIYGDETISFSDEVEVQMLLAEGNEVLNYNLKILADITDGILMGDNVEFHSVSINSKTLKPHALFVPIKGECFDGHDFINEAFAQGAIACFSEKKLKNEKPYVLIKNARVALGLFAAHHRKGFQKPVLGLTGSLGKTTTKALIAAILRQKHTVLSPEVSMNNDLGVPLTLLQLGNHDYAVIEMGSNHFGEIAYLTNITKPDAALITNIASAHLEYFKDLTGVAKEKMSIFQGLAKDGVAVINADDSYSKGFLKIIGDRKTISFGFAKNADVRAENIRMNSAGQASFNLMAKTMEGEINLQCYGEHNVKNALAAVAITRLYDISFSDVKAGLESVTAVTSRLKQRAGLNGSTIIDDSYSAIPEAVTAALKVLACAKGKKIFVFAGMAELNPDQIIERHQEIGFQAKACGVDELIILGDQAKYTAEAFGPAKQFDDKQQLLAYTKKLLADDVTLLIKGSRGMRLEDVVAELVEEEGI